MAENKQTNKTDKKTTSTKSRSRNAKTARLEKELQLSKKSAGSKSSASRPSYSASKNASKKGKGAKHQSSNKNSLKPAGQQYKNSKGPDKKRSRASIIIAVIIIAGICVYFASSMFKTANEMFTDEISTSDFIAAVEQDRVENVVFDAGAYTVTGTYYPSDANGKIASQGYNGAVESLNSAVENQNNGDQLSKVQTNSSDTENKGTARGYKATFVGQDSLLELMQKHPNIQYEIKLPSGIGDLLITLLPIVCVALIIFFFFNQMSKMNNQQMGFGKTKARKAAEERPKVKFDDVAGVDEAVEEISEIKDFLSNPAKYQKMGAKIPRGCLLVGPPGTGKTLLARAVAGEAGVPFFNISGSDFVEMFVGVGASRVRDLFSQAKAAAPSIIFIDEIDAVGRQRGAGLGGGHDEREQTLNQMLVEMDGFDQSDSVVLIAATNRADILDPALLRPGRFDRQIVVDAPDVAGREKILKVHSKDKPIQKSVDLKKIAALTPGFTGADLANLMNESALLSARKGKKTISQLEITESMERVIAGPERKSRIMDDETKNIIAYHESGHALVGHSLPKADPVHKISIISRGRALGYTLSIPKEDKVLNSYREMMDELAVFMGGRVAEEIFCNDITTGASNDLERATKVARSIVTQYGMSAELGTQVFGQPNHEVFLGRDYGNTQDYSELTAQRIDKEVARIMKEAHDTAYKILSSNKKLVDQMASVLLERETIEGEACTALLEGKWEEYLAKNAEGNKPAAKAADTGNKPAAKPAITGSKPASKATDAGNKPSAKAADTGNKSAVKTTKKSSTNKPDTK